MVSFVLLFINKGLIAIWHPLKMLHVKQCNNIHLKLCINSLHWIYFMFRNFLLLKIALAILLVPTVRIRMPTSTLCLYRKNMTKTAIKAWNNKTFTSNRSKLYLLRLLKKKKQKRKPNKIENVACLKFSCNLRFKVCPKDSNNYYCKFLLLTNYLQIPKGN